ncbi:hypothetical protein ACJX0J_028536, partial [Zea mays]
DTPMPWQSSILKEKKIDRYYIYKGRLAALCDRAYETTNIIIIYKISVPIIINIAQIIYK